MQSWSLSFVDDDFISFSFTLAVSGKLSKNCFHLCVPETFWSEVFPDSPTQSCDTPLQNCSFCHWVRHTLYLIPQAQLQVKHQLGHMSPSSSQWCGNEHMSSERFQWGSHVFDTSQALSRSMYMLSCIPLSRMMWLYTLVPPHVLPLQRISNIPHRFVLFDGVMNHRVVAYCCQALWWISCNRHKATPSRNSSLNSMQKKPTRCFSTLKHKSVFFVFVFYGSFLTRGLIAPSTAFFPVVEHWIGFVVPKLICWTLSEKATTSIF